MKTRLMLAKEKYAIATALKTTPLQNEVIYKLYDAKMELAKKYHGKKFDELYECLQKLNEERYEFGLIYEKNPTESNRLKLEKMDQKYIESKQKLFERV